MTGKEKRVLMMETTKDRLVCPVCGQHHFEEEDFYEVCPVCGWEDDGLQRDNPDYAGGANRMSLNEAKVAYREGRGIE